MKESKSSENDSGKKGLKRHLGIFSVFAICTGAAFSSGFFLLPGIAAEDTGPSLPLAYLAAGILMLPAILSISELSAAMPRSGGPYFFVTRSFGPMLGMIGAFGKFIQLILKGAFAFVGVGIYLSLLIDVSVELIAVILIIVFTGINLLGVRQTATTEKILVIVLLVILTYFLLAGGNEIFTAPNVDLREDFEPLLPYGWEGFITATALVFISFGGVAQVASVAEEVKKPSISFPKGILISLAVSSFFYLAGVALMISLVPPTALEGDETPAASAVDVITQWPFPIWIMVIAALAAFASTGNAAILSASRYPYALAKDELLWSKFGAVTNKGIPKNGVLLSGLISIALVLLLNVKEIAKIASAFLLFVFLSLCLAVIIFRESKKQEYQPAYKSPLYPWTQVLGVIIYIWLIYQSGTAAMAFIAGVFVAGFLWYSFGIKRKPRMSPAINFLFQRFAPGQHPQMAKTPNLATLNRGISTAVENAIFIDLDKKKDFEDVIYEAAEALSRRLGGKSENMAEILQEEIQHWKNPVEYNISVAPALLKEIEQPEMVIIRGNIAVGDRDLDGLIVVVDDKSSSNRLVQTLSQLEIAIHHPSFPKAWKEAGDLSEIKDALLVDLQIIYLNIRQNGPTGSLADRKIEQLDLPEHSVVGAVYRKGEILNPEKDLRLQEGDELILIGRGKAFEQLAEKFSEE